jgi:hypothetical protein
VSGRNIVAAFWSSATITTTISLSGWLRVGSKSPAGYSPAGDFCGGHGLGRLGVMPRPCFHLVPGGFAELDAGLGVCR